MGRGGTSIRAGAGSYGMKYQSWGSVESGLRSNGEWKRRSERRARVSLRLGNYDPRKTSAALHFGEIGGRLKEK